MRLVSFRRAMPAKGQVAAPTKHANDCARSESAVVSLSLVTRWTKLFGRSAVQKKRVIKITKDPRISVYVGEANIGALFMQPPDKVAEKHRTSGTDKIQLGKIEADFRRPTLGASTHQIRNKG